MIKDINIVINVLTLRTVSASAVEGVQMIIADALTACAVCGKSQNKSTSKNGESTVQGQRFSAK